MKIAFHRSVLTVALSLGLGLAGALVSAQADAQSRAEPKPQPMNAKLGKVVNAALKEFSTNPGKAFSDLQAAQPQAKTNYEKAFVAQVMAQIKANQQQYAAALPFAKQAVELNALANQQHFAMMFLVAQLNLAADKYAETLSAVEAWESASGQSNAQSKAMKANSLYRLGRSAEAAAAADAAIKASSTVDENLYRIKIASLFDAKQFGAAAAAAQDLLAKKPGDAETMRLLVQIYLSDKGKEAQAAGVLRSAYDSGSLTSEKDIIQLAEIYGYTEKYADATSVLTGAMAKGLVQPSARVYQLLGDSYYNSQKAAQAIEAYGKGAPMAGDGNLFKQHGHLLIEAKRWKEAQSSLKQAFAKGKLKNQGEALILLGTAESELGNRQAAIDAFTKAKGFPESKTTAETWLKTI
jgi:hypothetical protein